MRLEYFSLRSKSAGGALFAALLAMAAVLAWQAAAVRYVYGGNWTGLFCMGERSPGPPLLRQGACLWKGSGGYDGQFYRYIAHDPFLKKGYHRFIDDGRLRCRRILVPAAAYLLAFGDDDYIDAAYIALIALSIGLGVYWSARLAQIHGAPAFTGLVFLVSAAALVSADRMLLEAPLAAFFMGFAVYCEEGRLRKAYAVAALAFLAREAGLLLIAGMCLHYVLSKRWRAAAVFATAAAPALAWYAVVMAYTRPSYAYRVFSVPVWGVVRRLFVLRPVGSGGAPWVRNVLIPFDVIALLGFLATLAIACWWIRREGPGAVPLTLALFVALGLMIGGRDHMMDAYGYARPVAPLLAYVLVRAVIERDWRTALAPLAVSAWIAIFYVRPALRIASGLATLLS